MLDKLTREDFERYKGATFQLSVGNGQTVDVLLHDVASHGQRQKEDFDRNPNIRPEPFSIVVRLPQSLAPPQTLFELAHEEMGALPSLFFVPVGMDENGRYYEAVFN